jgi:hypothetical protein
MPNPTEVNPANDNKLVDDCQAYIDSLSPKEKRAYLIAVNHLGMSFTLEKSVGFLQWKKTRDASNTQT